jgi:hypothetical protein
VNSPESLVDAVVQELGSLLDEFGFALSEDSPEVVRYASASAVLTVTAYAGDHGQVDVIVEPGRAHSVHERLVIGRMVGRASLVRVLELAAQDLRTNEPALRGDLAFFAHIGTENQRLATAWTAYYAKQGPRPTTGKLPWFHLSPTY